MAIVNYTVPPRVMQYADKWHAEGGTPLIVCDTREEAEQAKRAFEQVLAPRFTRDEAIGAIHKALAGHVWSKDVPTPAEVIAFTLEALAVAGVFVDQPAQAMDQHASRLETMADKLDAAGIR